VNRYPMRLRERIAWGLVATAVVLTAGQVWAVPDCEPATTTTTMTAPPLIIEPPHLVPPVTLERLPETP
jgi:hypothetical protein